MVRMARTAVKLTDDSHSASFSESMDNVDLSGHMLYVNGVAMTR